MKKVYAIAVVAIAAVVVVGGAWLFRPEPAPTQQTKNLNPEIYQPIIDPQEFSTDINHPLFSLPVGRKFTYQAQTADGLEKISIEIEAGTKNILGVETVIYHDRVYLDDQLIEDTRDYLAQDRLGNVWYFGEEVNNYENSVLIDHRGSFIAGVNGAQPGIWIKGAQTVGDSYRQEYAPGEAEDMRDVVAINQTVTTGLGTYTDCVKFYDWTPLDPQSQEYKYYCPAVQALVLTEEHGVRSELTKIEP